MPSESVEPPIESLERRVLDAVANWRRQPDSSGALLRLMQESATWLAAKEPSDG